MPATTPQIMGILNLTPDSFSDGGQFNDIDAAVAHGLTMAQQGAAYIDVGGESTRPGSSRVDSTEQKRRVVEPIRQLRSSLDAAGHDKVAISIDTTLAKVAEAALDAGAAMLNDISGGREDAGMFALAAERRVPLVLMHMLGQPGTMQDNPQYKNVIAVVMDFLIRQVTGAQTAGVAEDKLLIDPGIGFGKTTEHNLALLAGLDRFVATGYGVLLGASRKRLIQAISPTTATSSAADHRLGGTIATTLAGHRAGVRIVRVHDVAANRQALDVASAMDHVQTHR